jgi:hypothetical protein
MGVISANSGAPLGLESGTIPDSDITASSAYDFGIVGPQHGRYYTVVFIITNKKTLCNNNHFTTCESFLLSYVGFRSWRTEDILDFRSLIHEIYCGISSCCVSLSGIYGVGYELSRALSIY